MKWSSAFLKHSFSGWHLSLVFVYLFFSWCKMSCGQGVEQLPKGRRYKGEICFFLLLIFCQTESPLVQLRQDLDQNVCASSAVLFWVLIYLTKCLVEQSQWNHLRINPMFSVAVPSRIINSFGPVCIQGLTPLPTTTKTTLSGSCFT